MVRQLAFTSRARAGLKPAETSSIIGASRSNNARDGVTGVLLYSGETFLQLVEGSDAALVSLWRRLLGDDRHRQVATLHDGSVHARWFESWRAGYMPELTLTAQLERWRAMAAPMPDDALEQLRSFLRDAEAF